MADSALDVEIGGDGGEEGVVDCHPEFRGQTEEERWLGG
jgi:hypothetical protein